jgi:hypothetical protein
MSKIALTGPAGGTATYTVTAPTGATDRVITLPDNTGTLISTASTFGGTGPAFSAYQSSAQALTAFATTKVQFQTEEFDTNSNYDNATNYRFTPTVAGYYQVNSAVGVGTACQLILTVYKNGSSAKQLFWVVTFAQAAAGTALVYMNGSTDYLEIYVNSSASQNITATSTATYFQAALVRAA